LAACIGVRFDLNILASISDSTVPIVAQNLYYALRENCVMPAGENTTSNRHRTISGGGSSTSSTSSLSENKPHETRKSFKRFMDRLEGKWNSTPIGMIVDYQVK